MRVKLKRSVLNFESYQIKTLYRILRKRNVDLENIKSPLNMQKINFALNIEFV